MQSHFDRRNAIFAALLSTALSSLAILIQAGLAKQAEAVALAAISACFGGIFLSVANARSFKKHTLKQFIACARPLLVLILLRVVIGGTLFWSALGLTIGAKAIFFTKAEPYFIIFWQWVFERSMVSRKHIWLLLVHILGAALLSLGAGGDLTQQAQGDLLLILAVLVLALSYRFGAQISKELGSMTSSAVTQLSGGVLLLMLALMTGVDFSSCFELSVLWKIIAAALMWNVFGIFFWFHALKTLEPWVVSSVRALGPLFALPVAWFWQGQRLNSIQLLGAALVLITSYAITKFPKQVAAKTLSA